MPGKTIYLGDNPNDFLWSIPKTEDSGHRFERLIARYLKLHVASRDASITIHPTRRVHDEGRDFEVAFTGTVRMFGFTVAATTDGPARVFVECKSTAEELLDDAFLVDAGQHKDDEAAAYVLVTNSVVTPYCQWRAQREWQRRGARFCLVDRRRLIDLINRHDLSAEAKRLRIPLPEESHLLPFDPQALVVSCQTERRTMATSQTLSVYVSLANYGESSVLADLHLATDVSWVMPGGSYERSVSPGMLETIELVAERQDLDGTAELGLQLTVNGRSTRLSVARARFDLALEPPFVGESHRRLALELRQRIETSPAFLLVSLRGEAGVGKTRTVSEALEPLVHGRYIAFTYQFTRHGLPDFRDFEREIGPLDDVGLLTDELRVDVLLRLAAASGLPIVLHLEDLHHAEEKVIAVFKRAVLDPPTCIAPLVVILAGRDDHTFPNEAYYSLLQLVADERSEHTCAYALEALTDEDARKLIKDVVVNMPEPGVDRVYALGQNNPFVIVEVIQYLLDVELAHLRSRRTVGVLNPEVFAGREGLPESVGELYDLRLASLRTADQGEMAARFLIVASFFGLAITDEVRTSFFDGSDSSEACWSLLRKRRFVREAADARQATFAHENLLHHLRRWSRRAENAQFASVLVLDRPGLCKRLDILDQGEVHFLHGDHAAALACFEAPRKRIAEVTNVSSEEIERSYFTYLPALFHCGLATGMPVELLANVALAYGYMGVHNFPLVAAENACDTALALLDRIYSGKEEGRRERLALRQLRAHALQNMGQTSRALQEMLEIEAALRSCEPWPEVSFDLYDRFAEYYRKINHPIPMDAYDRCASRCVEATRDRKLMAAHQITHASTRLFSGAVAARKRAAAAHKAAVASGVKRFVTYTRLTELVVKSIYSQQNTEVLAEVANEARTMLRDAVFDSYADSIMRLELLLGTISLYTAGTPDEGRRLARTYVVSGQANSVRYGNGLFDWAFDNLAAVIDLEDPARVDDDIRARFESCLERLRRRGLAFLGAAGGTYPNAFAVSNIVRWFGALQESRGVAILQERIGAYNNRFAEDIHSAQELVRRAVKGRAIFWPEKSSVAMLRYPAATGYFTPVF
jgi:hypothetical protein